MEFLIEPLAFLLVIISACNLIGMGALIILFRDADYKLQAMIAVIWFTFWLIQSALLRITVILKEIGVIII